MPPQSVVPIGHAHALAVQSFPPPHMTPQAPQLLGSLVSFTHAPPHAVKLVGQPAVVHAPALQVDIGPQTLPHAPQLFLSAATSTHAPLQIC
jgi:hypothetical protein